MKTKTEEIVIKNTYTRLILEDGFVFSHVSDILGLMEELESIDGFFNNLVITNMEKTELDKLVLDGVVSKNAKGSYHQGKNYRAFYSELYKLLYNDELCL